MLKIILNIENKSVFKNFNLKKIKIKRGFLNSIHQKQ